MTEDRPADFTPRRQTESRIRVVECRLNSCAVEEIAREVFATGLAHLVGFEERATNAGLCMFAKTIPSIGVGLNWSVEEIFQ